jgi:LysM repeat protein
MRASALAGLAAGILIAALSPTANADITHVVQRGHTIEAIAHRYHVSEKAIIDANHLKDPKHLKPGQTLIIPGVDAPKKKGDKDKDAKDKRDKAEAAPHGGPAHAATAALEPPPEPRGHGDSDTGTSHRAPSRPSSG